MSREDTLSSQNVLTKSTDATICRFFTASILVTAAVSAYFVFKTPSDSLGDPSDEYVIKNIPKIFTKLEAVDPEDRDVFHGFRTSFLPPDDIVLSRDDVKEEKEKLNARIKRRSSFTFTSRNNENSADERDDVDEPNHKESDSVENEYDSSDEEAEDNPFDRIIHPETHVDRGPLDDVVEQVRRQPELDEGEMETVAHNIYKPSKTYGGIHAFWKDQGDRDTILKTQANIMKQYMDPKTDPCDDFYQYACGNWAALNPIPADKAGYDTFEILRENLDAVLKDLLEFKSHEQVPSVYPGSKLDLDENILTRLTPTIRKHNILKKFKHSVEIIENISKQLFNKSMYENNKYDIIELVPNKKTQIGNRIRRYLHHKEKSLKPKVNIKTEKGAKHFKNYYNTKSSKHYPIKNRKIKTGHKIPKTKWKRELFESEIEDEVSKKNNDLSYGDATLKARFLFKSCMNYDILHKRGHEPLLDLLDLLGGWPILRPQWNDSNFDWLDLMAKLRLYNNDILISEWVGPDIKNSDEFVIQFDQTSLGLPTRDYFLQDCNKVYLQAYKNYLIKVALLLGGDQEIVVKSASDLIEFETKLAKITSAPEDRRNVSELYRRMTLEKLENLVPEIEWRKYLCIVLNRTVESDETVVLFALNYVRHLVQLINETDSKILSNYLLWRFVRHRVNNLDDRFQTAKQQFYFILFGREQSPPRWKNCISQVNSNMGMALGSMFVRKYFDETSKNDTLAMTKELQQSFRELLHLTDWIDNDTKKLAAHKVDAMMLRIGYPDFILNEQELNDRYKEVKIHPDKYFENVLNILQHLTKMEQSRLGQPVNKTLWNTAPAVVNAYYSRNKNQIMFPAGILQPPFYHRHFPRSLNYGGIGVVIGHEITHGFDDKGRLFDCNGNLHRWWSDSAIESFHNRAQCLIDQYGKYIVPEVHMKLDGVNTQGENIADNGGIKQSFRAYLHSLSKNGIEGETLPNLNHTHTQLFFLNFAQVWCGAMRPEAMRNKLKTAVHAPGRFRVIGTLSNSHDFAREFHCPPGSPMNPTNKCSVW